MKSILRYPGSKWIDRDRLAEDRELLKTYKEENK